MMVRMDDKVTKLVFSIIEYKVKRGEEVFYTGFGKFYLKDSEVSFKASLTLKDALNEDWDQFMERMKKEYREG